MKNKLIGKVSMGYGGVEFFDDGSINVITEPCPLSSEDGMDFKEETDKVQQKLNLGYMVEFLQGMLYEGIHVLPLEFGDLGNNILDGKFMVNEEYLLHVVLAEETACPVLVRPTGYKLYTIKFTYEGDFFDEFFREIKVDFDNATKKGK